MAWPPRRPHRIFDISKPSSGTANGNANNALKHGGDLATFEDDHAYSTGFQQCLQTALLSVAVMTVLVVLLLIFVASAHSAPEVNFDWPEPSSSIMGTFKKFAITTDHGICSDIGKQTMSSGGNAVEAAISALFCLSATNPQSSGLGGGFLLTLYNRTTGSCIALDARESAPAAATRDMFLNDSDGSKYGFRAAGVPGELAGYWYLFRHHSSGLLSWSDLVQPTIRLLKRGVPVSRYLDDVMQVKERHFRAFPSMKEWINPTTNSTYKEGELMPRKKLLATLERIAAAEDPEELFYRGEFADTIDKEMKENGGLITKADLAGYKVRVYDGMVNAAFRAGLSICGGPPPSGFVVTQLLLSLFSDLYPNGTTQQLATSPLVYHHQIEAQKFAYAQRTLLGDVAFVQSADELSKKMITKPFIHDILKKLKAVKRAQDSTFYGGDGKAQVPDHGTSHVSVLDAEGNGLAVTTTINRWFGAAVESEAFGVVWNDEMDDFSTPGMANGFGFAPSETNFIEPGKRPMSSMSPLVIFDNHTHKVRVVGGASGGSKIISALSKSVIRSLIFGESIKEAIDAPMLHNQFTPDITQIDGFFPPELKSRLESEYGQMFRNTTGFEGIVQTIFVKGEEITACGDFRRKTEQQPGGL